MTGTAVEEFAEHACSQAAQAFALSAISLIAGHDLRHLDRVSVENGHRLKLFLTFPRSVLPSMAKVPKAKT